MYIVFMKIYLELCILYICLGSLRFFLKICLKLENPGGFYLCLILFQQSPSVNSHLFTVGRSKWS